MQRAPLLLLLGVATASCCAPHTPSRPATTLSPPPVTPRTVNPSSVTPPDVTPASVTPTSVTPRNVTSRTVTPTSVTPRTVTPRTVNPSSVTPPDVTPASVTPTSVTPRNVTSRTVTPTSVTPRTVTPRTVNPSSVTPPDVTPTSVTPTSVMPRNVTSRTVTPTSVTPRPVTPPDVTPPPPSTTKCTELPPISQKEADDEWPGTERNLIESPRFTDTNVICGGFNLNIHYKAMGDQIRHTTGIVCKNGTWFDGPTNSRLLDTTQVSCLGLPTKCKKLSAISKDEVNVEWPGSAPNEFSSPTWDNNRVNCNHPTLTIYYKAKNGPIKHSEDIECRDGNWFDILRDVQLLDTTQVSCLGKLKKCKELSAISQIEADAEWPGSAMNVINTPLPSDTNVVCDGNTPNIYYKTKDSPIRRADALVCENGKWRAGPGQLFDTAQVSCLGEPRKCKELSAISQKEADDEWPGSAKNLIAPPNITNTGAVCKGNKDTPHIYYKTRGGKIRYTLALECRNGKWFAGPEANQQFDTAQVSCLGKTRNCKELLPISKDDINDEWPGSAPNLISPPIPSDDNFICIDNTRNIAYKANDGPIQLTQRMVCKGGKWFVGPGSGQMVDASHAYCVGETRKCKELTAISQIEADAEWPGSAMNVINTPLPSDTNVVCDGNTPNIYYKTKDSPIRRADALVCENGKWRAGPGQLFDTAQVSCLGEPRKCKELSAISQKEADDEWPGSAKNLIAPPNITNTGAVCKGNKDTPHIYYKTRGGKIRYTLALECRNGKWFAGPEANQQFDTAQVSCLGKTRNCKELLPISKDDINDEWPGSAPNLISPPIPSDDNFICIDNTRNIAYKANDGPIQLTQRMVCKGGKWFVGPGSGQMVDASHAYCVGETRKCKELTAISQIEADAEWPGSAMNVINTPLPSDTNVVCDGNTPNIYYKTKDSPIRRADALVCENGKWRAGPGQLFDTAQVSCLGEPRKCKELSAISQKEADDEWPGSAKNLIAPPNITNTGAVCKGNKDTPHIYYKTRGGKIRYTLALECRNGKWFAGPEANQQFDTAQVSCLGKTRNCKELLPISKDDINDEWPGSAPNLISPPIPSDDNFICIDNTRNIAYKANDGPIQLTQRMVCKGGKWFVGPGSGQMVDASHAYCVGETRKCKELTAISQMEADKEWPGSEKNLIVPPVRSYDDVSCSGQTPNMYYKSNNGAIQSAGGLECKDNKWHVAGGDMDESFNTTDVSCLGETRKCTKLEQISLDVLVNVAGWSDSDANTCAFPSETEKGAKCSGGKHLLYLTSDGKKMQGSPGGLKCMGGQWIADALKDKPQFKTAKVCCT